MNYLDIKLEEVAPWRITNNVVKLSAGFQIDVLVDATATIFFTSAEDWHLSGLTVPASNGRWEKDKRQEWEHTVHAGEPLWVAIEHYLTNIDRETVEAAIVAHMQDEYESRKFDEGKEISKLRGAA